MKKFLCFLMSVMLLGGTTLVCAQDLVIKKVDLKGVEMWPEGIADEPVWNEIEAIPIEKHFFTSETTEEQPTVTAFFKMFYTDQFLYVYVDVTDDVHYPVWETGEIKSEHLYDKVELYFDVNDNLKDGKGPAYVNGYMDKGHFQLAPPFDDEFGYGNPYLPSGVLLGALSEQVFVGYSLKDDGKSYGIEFEFPLDRFTNDRDEYLSMTAFQNLPQGMGFDVIVVDNDNDGNGRKRMVWKNQGPVEPYNNMDNCGVVRFGDENGSMGISSEKVDAVAVKAYPNPVADRLTVEGDFDTVSIFNIVGQEVKTSATSSMNVEDLSAGIYIVRTYKDGKCNGFTKITKK